MSFSDLCREMKWFNSSDAILPTDAKKHIFFLFRRWWINVIDTIWGRIYFFYPCPRTSRLSARPKPAVIPSVLSLNAHVWEWMWRKHSVRLNESEVFVNGGLAIRLMKPIRSGRRGGCWVIHDVWSPGLCYQPLMMKAETDRMLLIIPSICPDSDLPHQSWHISNISMTDGRKRFIRAPFVAHLLGSGNQNNTEPFGRGTIRSHFRRTVAVNQLSICLQCFSERQAYKNERRVTIRMSFELSSHWDLRFLIPRPLLVHRYFLAAFILNWIFTYERIEHRDSLSAVYEGKRHGNTVTQRQLNKLSGSKV